MKKGKILIALLLTFTTLITQAQDNAIETISEQEETNTTILDLKYPKSENSTVNQVINTYVNEVKAYTSSFNDEETAEDLPGKNGVYLTYSVKYNQANAMSLLFNFSTFNRGAAHPNTTVKTLNFINNQKVSLSDLFYPNSNYLEKIANISREILLKKDISEEKWIKEGTKPTLKNYKNWYFNKDGLVIIFDTYQVAAYVFGPQEVTIPRSLLEKELKADLVGQIWNIYLSPS